MDLKASNPFLLSLAECFADAPMTYLENINVLAGPSPRRASISSRCSMLGAGAHDPGTQSLGDVDEDDNIPVGHHFTLACPNPRKYYK